MKHPRACPIHREPGLRPPSCGAALAALAALAAAALLALSGAPALASTDPAAVQELLRNAGFWQSQGRDDKLRAVLEKLLAIDERQPQALLLLGELELRQGRPAQAQRLLDRLQAIPTASAQAAELQTLQRVYTQDLARLQQLRLLRRGGNQARAQELARALFPEGRAPGALGPEFAALLTGKAPPRAAAVARAPGRNGPAAATRRAPAPHQAATANTRPAETAAGDRYWPLLREARTLLEGERLAEAAERAASAAALQPDEPEGRLLRAEIAARLGHDAQAEAALRALLGEPAVARRARPRLIELLMRTGRVDEALAEARQPEGAAAFDTTALRRAAEAQAAAGKPEQALRWFEAGLALRPLDPWLRHDLARLYAAQGQAAKGRQLMIDGVAAAPADAEMRYAAALVLASQGQEDQALALLDDVPDAARSDGQRALAQRMSEARAQRVADAAAVQAAALEASQRAQEAIEARRQPTEQVALFTYRRRADDGRSSLRGEELLMVLERPYAGWARGGETGTGWLQIDPVRLDAGAVPAEFGAAADFGQILASGVAPAAPLEQQARGLNVGAGWRGPGQRWDIGVIGAGFEVPNLVGGWSQQLNLAGLDATLEVSRRVLTGSLLSYAGTRDPVSGRVWGGVTLNAATLRLGHYDADGSVSASLLAGLLKGRNVADNSTLQLRLAADRNWIDEPTLRFNAGLSLAVWHYRRNLGFYSFGQGGYYSPQRYTSLGLPLQLQGRQGDWSYRMRAVVGRSWTYEADTPYYPSDPALQAAAGSPQHSGGGNGGGTSHSLRAEIERRLTPHWSVGASYNADRSAYYAPTQWLFYLRHSAKPQAEMPPLPRPVQPYSQQ